MQQAAKITRDLFTEGKEVEEIVAHLADLGYKRTYLACLSSLKKGKLSVKGRVNRDRPWSEDEDRILKERLAAGCSIEQLRKILFRKTTAVKERIEHLKMQDPDQREKRKPEYDVVMVASMPWLPREKKQEESRP